MAIKANQPEIIQRTSAANGLEERIILPAQAQSFHVRMQGSGELRLRFRSKRLQQCALTVDGQPDDGDQFRINNHVFEFESADGVTEGATSVAIGSDADETRDNLVAALETVFTGDGYSFTNDTANSQVIIQDSDHGFEVAAPTNDSTNLGVPTVAALPYFLILPTDESLKVDGIADNTILYLEPSAADQKIFVLAWT